MKRCWRSCWGIDENDEESTVTGSSLRVRKRKRLDPVVKDAREREDHEWHKRIEHGYLVVRVNATQPEFAYSNTVTDEIDKVGMEDTRPITIYVHDKTKVWVARNVPVQGVWYSGFRKHDTGCDISFPYKASTAAVSEFMEHVRRRLLALEGIESIEVLSPGFSWVE